MTRRSMMAKPACGEYKPHKSHRHESMDIHFKMSSTWCSGLCEWCFKNGVPQEFIDGTNKGIYGYGLHGNGAHK